MLSALDVAKYLLYIAFQNGDTITNLKMQKLLYYAQAWYMVNNEGKLLFADDIQAWKYGPVVPVVYQYFKEYNSYPIHYDISEDDIANVPQHEREFLDEFAVEFFSVSATELVSMTHNEAPWKTAYAKGINAVIDTNEMYNFYKALLNENS
ncbi:MAG: DUF4065 domain-containing protein [Spirochaetales bacterium]|jgi:uncharacterized phage-associated protein|nr:DUF4065 domain-containing protein [Spirochaetales bacterium]